MRLALSKDGETHASAASYNNHWGVPLSLARCPADARYAVFEMGMNHAGEIAPLSRLVRPHVAMITTIAPVHLEFFGSLTKIADAKAEIFLGLEPGGAAVLNRDIAQFAHLARRASEAGVARIVSFGEHAKADARLIKCVLHPRCSTVQADILGTELTYKIGAPGRHLVHEFARRAGGRRVGRRRSRAGGAGARRAQAVSGRGAPIELDLPGGAALLIDESYNANPASVDAALALLGQAPIGPQGRRIAVLGDMLELGPKGKALHRGLAAPVERQCHRSGVLLRPADAFAVAGSSRRPPRRLCRGLRRARSASAAARSVPAMSSWSKARSVRAWRPSSRRCNGCIRSPRFRWSRQSEAASA